METWIYLEIRELLPLDAEACELTLTAELLQMTSDLSRHFIKTAVLLQPIYCLQLVLLPEPGEAESFYFLSSTPLQRQDLYTVLS